MTLNADTARIVKGPSGPLNVLEFGDRRSPAVLLVHPINLRAECWADFVGQLVGTWRVIAPDLRGHGASTPRGPYGVAAWAEDCLGVADALEVETFHAVGGSLGGTICVSLAANHGERVRSVMTLGSAARSGVQRERVLGMMDEFGVQGMFRKAFTEFTFGPSTPPEVVERGIEMSNPHDESVVRAVWNAAQDTDIRDQVPRLTCPVTVLTGEHDTTCPPDRGRELAALARARFDVLPGVGHMPMLEAPAVVARAWEAHVDQQDEESR